MKILATFATVAMTVGAPLAASAQTVRETIYDFRSSSAAPVVTISDIDRPAPYGVYGGLPPYEVLTIVRSMGFDPQSRPIRRGGVYVVRAFDDQDIPVRVIVDARSGRVVNVAERGPMRDDDDGPAVGDRVLSAGEAYPVPPQPVPGGEIYRDRDYRGPDYRAPDYRAQDYRTQDYRTQDYRTQDNRTPSYRSSDTTVYRPAPYAPSETTQSIAPRPRVASRAPVAVHAKAAPTPRARPATTATATPAAAVTTPAAKAAVVTVPKAEQAAKAEPATTPKGSTTQTTTTSAVAQDASHRGTSIPAPVASRKTASPPDATPPAAKPETPAAKPSGGDPALVPVAPLE